ncbi:MAG: homoserine O-succinyltransferase [Gammaproteobacteria bacterium]
MSSTTEPARAQPSFVSSRPRPRHETQVMDGMCRIPRLDLMRGGHLDDVEISWRLAGPSRGPVVAVLGGISADKRAATTDDHRGWWSGLIGPGRAVDTGRYRVLSFDWLGGSAGSSGPASGSFGDTPFPAISPEDQGQALIWILGQLGLTKLHGFIGASYGGMVALAFAASHPDRLDRLVVVSAAHRAHALATAWRSVQRRIVRLGLETGAGEKALSLSRGLAMTTYRSPEEFDARFAGPPKAEEGFYRFPVEDYLDARGEDFVQRVVPESYLCLSESIDLQDVDPTLVVTPTTLVAVRQDQLVPLVQMRDLARRIRGACRLVEIDSIFGHDAFLKEDDTLTPVFLEALEGELR